MLFAVALCFFVATCTNVCAQDQLADAYNKITDGLITIRKQFPVVQPRVYALLDQVNTLYKVASQKKIESEDLKKKLQERQQETQDQMDAAKKMVETTKTELAKKFEEQSARLQALQAERDQLLSKISLAQGQAPALPAEQKQQQQS